MTSSETAVAILGAACLLTGLLGACTDRPARSAGPFKFEPVDDSIRVRRFVDEEKHIVCYLFWSEGISCVRY